MTVESVNSNETKLNLLNLIFLSGTPILALIMAIWHFIVFGIGKIELVIFFFWYFACGLSITVGYHRLFSHRSHTAIWPLRLFYALFGAGAFQNSILEWSSDHRNHHKDTDSDKDPYNALRGFWWSHIGWIIIEDDIGEPDYTNVKDLQKDWVVMFQHNHIFKIGFIIGMVLPGIVGYMFGGLATGIGGFVWGGLVRTVFVHHGTFFINSAAHVWGKQPYATQNTSKDSFWLAFLTFGEGYHNFHHTFQADYRNGIRWWQWDPSKWCIWLGSIFKFNRGLKRTPDWSIGLAKMRTKFESLVPVSGKERFILIFEERFDEMCNSFKEQKRKLKSYKAEMVESSKQIHDEIKSQVKDLKKSIREIESQFEKLVIEMTNYSLT
ncbi:MAG: fatty acid desaturase [Euryarchaeota archaeon]|nr:fatty acid desaturase [Euryarchaeota archaeon]